MSDSQVTLRTRKFIRNPHQEKSENVMKDEPSTLNHNTGNPVQPPEEPHDFFQTSTSTSHMPSLPTSLSQSEQTSQPWTAASQASGDNVFMGGDVFMGSHGMSYSNSTMFAPPVQDSFLFGIDRYAQNQQSQITTSDLPPSPFTQASPFNSTYSTTQAPFSQQPQPSFSDSDLLSGGIGPQALLQQFQRPPPPPPPQPRRKKVIERALRNLLILSSFPDLEPPPTSSRSRATASLLKDKDRAALIQLSTTLFHWSTADAISFVNAMLISNIKVTKKAQLEREAALKPVKPLCAVTNAVARYRDPETGIAYRDARAFGVLRGVVGGGFVWSGDLGCYVGGRAKPLESMGGKGFLGMPPVKGVPRRFLEMQKKVVAPSSAASAQEDTIVVTDGTPQAPSRTTMVPEKGDGPVMQGGQGAAVKAEEGVKT